MQVCNGDITIAREPASMNLVISPKGIVQRIALTLSPDVFDEVAPELIRKFGKPTSKSCEQIMGSGLAFCLCSNENA